MRLMLRVAALRVLAVALTASAAIVSAAAAQDISQEISQAISNARFADLAKACQAGASAPASATARRIGEIALAEHRTFRGSRVDNAGRIVLFGRTEVESDQELDSPVAAKDIPWQRVLGFWDELQSRPNASAPHWALEVWFYPELRNDPPSAHLHRKRMRLDALLAAIDRLDFSQFGEDAALMRSALKQSAIRASISDVAWSAAFIGAVMRQAGLAPANFSYGSSHIRYIVASIKQSLGDLGGETQNHVFRACDPASTRPRVGDLYCYHRHVEGVRGSYKPKPGMSLFRSLFRDLMQDPSVISRTHCDVVVRVDDAAKKVTVVGGNVHNSVTERTLNLNRRGVLSASQSSKACAPTASEKSEDLACTPTGHRWFVLLQTRT